MGEQDIQKYLSAYISLNEFDANQTQQFMSSIENLPEEEQIKVFSEIKNTVDSQINNTRQNKKNVNSSRQEINNKSLNSSGLNLTPLPYGFFSNKKEYGGKAVENDNLSKLKALSDSLEMNYQDVLREYYKHEGDKTEFVNNLLLENNYKNNPIKLEKMNNKIKLVRYQSGGMIPQEPTMQPEDNAMQGQSDMQQEIMQIVQMYAQITGENPEEVMNQVMQLMQQDPQQGEQILQQMMMVIQEAQGGSQQQPQGDPMMQQQGGDPNMMQQGPPMMEYGGNPSTFGLQIYGETLNIPDGLLNEKDISFLERNTNTSIKKLKNNKQMQKIIGKIAQNNNLLSESYPKAEFGTKLKTWNTKVNENNPNLTKGLNVVGGLMDGTFNALTNINNTTTDGKGRERTNVAKSSVKSGANAVQAASPVLNALDAIPIPGVKQAAQALTFGIGALVGRGVAKTKKEFEDKTYGRQDYYDNTKLDVPANMNPYGSQLAEYGYNKKDSTRDKLLAWANTYKRK